PVWSRNREDFDVLIYVANWPNRRQLAWDTLLRARAIENLSYTIGVNRVGVDANDLPYTGGSAIIDYTGQEMADLRDTEGTATATLEIAALEKFRDRFAFHQDADEFELIT
ncbi:MAG: nitrilase-related carbon-nitrogen hydrolase, partial [Woeseiaceae bacterium]|nr:nitrilase-related carbon-nitrogen hydrolase [Woeseiaceae bacterium]